MLKLAGVVALPGVTVSQGAEEAAATVVVKLEVTEMACAAGVGVAKPATRVLLQRKAGAKSGARKEPGAQRTSDRNRSPGEGAVAAHGAISLWHGCQRSDWTAAEFVDKAAYIRNVGPR